MRSALAACLIATAAHAQDDPSLATRFLEQERTAFARYEEENWEAAIAAFERQIAIFARNPRPYYNIACCYALDGKPERAATWLRMAIANGWRDQAHLERDPDFDKLRQGKAYGACIAYLADVRRRDPDPLPRPAHPSSVPAASSFLSILVASVERERRLLPDEELLEESQYRRMLFPVYDLRLGRLSRYLLENGDARDAAAAAHARVRTAMLYLVRADEEEQGDAPLRRSAARLVLTTAQDFLRGWAGSPLLAEVLYWRGFALYSLGQAPEAKRQWRTVVGDHPATRSAGRALADLCILHGEEGDLKDLARDYEILERDHAAILRDMRPRLLRARLMLRGVPEELRAQAGEHKGPVLYIFVATSVQGEQRLASLRALAKALELRPLVLCVDEPSDRVDAWLEEHAAGFRTAAGRELARSVGIGRLPTLILARGKRMLALDPSDAELTRLVSR